MLAGPAVRVGPTELGDTEHGRRVEQGAGAVRNRSEAVEQELELREKPAIDAHAVARRHLFGDVVAGVLERAVLRVREAVVAGARVFETGQEIVAVVGEL